MPYNCKLFALRIITCLIRIIIVIIILLLESFFTPALADGLSQKFEYQQDSKTLLSILADINNAVVWMVSICPLISKPSIPFSKPLAIFLSVTYCLLTDPSVKDFISRMHLCRQGNGEISRVSWESKEECMGVMNIISAHSFNPHKTGGKSRQAFSQEKWAVRAKAASDMAQLCQEALHWEMALISPINEVLSGALNIDRQCGLRRYGVNHSSDLSLSLSPSSLFLSRLWPILTLLSNKERESCVFLYMSVMVSSFLHWLYNMSAPNYNRYHYHFHVP